MISSLLQFDDLGLANEAASLRMRRYTSLSLDPSQIVATNSVCLCLHVFQVCVCVCVLWLYQTAIGGRSPRVIPAPSQATFKCPPATTNVSETTTTSLADESAETSNWAQYSKQSASIFSPKMTLFPPVVDFKRLRNGPQLAASYQNRPLIRWQIDFKIHFRSIEKTCSLA